MEWSSSGSLFIIMLFGSFTFTRCLDIKIGLLLDGSETSRELEWDYDDYVRSWGLPGLSVELETTDIAGLNAFQLYNSVCQQVANGTMVFITAADCTVLQPLSSLVSRLSVPVISVGEECAGATDDNLLNFPPEKTDISDALKGVLKTLAWQDLVFVYGNKEAALTVDSINAAMTVVNATVQSFVVRSEYAYSDIRSLLDYLHQYSDIKRQFVVLCDIDCLTELFRQVNAYDKSADQQGWYTYDARWILIGGRDILTSLPEFLGDVDHVAAIVPALDAYNASYSIVLGALAKSRWSLSAVNKLQPSGSSTDNYPAACGQKLELVDRFTAELQIQLSSTVCLNCSLYDIYGATYVRDQENSTSEGVDNDRGLMEEQPRLAGRRRQWELVGEWQELAGINLQTEIFPNIHHGLNGIHFVIGTNVWAPFIVVDDNSTSGFGGLCIEILEELKTNLNFSYVVVVPEDGQWGDLRNGTWNGLVGQLQTKSVDLTMAPLATNTGRQTVMDFSSAYFLEYTSVLVKYTNPSDTKWRLYINPFRWQVWLCLALAIPACGVIIWLMTRFNPFYSAKKATSGLGMVENAIFYTFGSFFTQGGVHLPEAQSGRFFIGFWWMYCMVVIATYSGNLIAFLTVSKATVPFQTLEEMTSQSSHTFGTMGGTALEYHLREAKSGLSKTIWDQIEQSREKDPDVLSSDQSVQIKKVLQGGYAYINDKTGFELEMAKETGCEIDMIKDEFIPFQYAVGLQNNSAYKTTFDSGVSKILESGVINKWKKKWWPRQSFCSRGIVTESKAVSVSDVQGAYYLMAIFLALSMLALFGEAAIRYNKLVITGQTNEKDVIKKVMPLEYDEYGRPRSTNA